MRGLGLGLGLAHRTSARVLDSAGLEQRGDKRGGGYGQGGWGGRRGEQGGGAGGAPRCAQPATQQRQRGLDAQLKCTKQPLRARRAARLRMRECRRHRYRRHVQQGVQCAHAVLQPLGKQRNLVGAVRVERRRQG